MDEALHEARPALADGIFPVGAILTFSATIIGRGRKSMGSNHLDHAEMIAIRHVFTL
ncbi:tRNA(Arg) A34 adenosine deaminase TadA [Sphingomonas endophytica]|uniref:tRNA(Arg) A34 adenosine deaminase TadA n=2 Tax=Sphingomonas endophytica TaxID=869719 RepID=A0ABR6N5M2_9SPHN|nr:tRNA(Arg) A34 adenosine deaminase TadA [Sphingomonas endophytica]